MKTESALSLDELEQLEALCLRHENATSEDDSSLENLLVDVSEPARRHFLRELLWQDIEKKQRAGTPVSSADYAFKSPDDMQIVDEVFDELAQESTSSDTGKTELPSRYQKLEEIGSGGIGSVWRVYDNRARRPLAVKALRSKFRQDRQANIRLEREAILTGGLQHPGVPPVHDYGQLTDRSVFFAMKLIEGQTLGEILDEQSDEGLDLQKKIGIFEKVAQTMAYVHSQNVIHRDLKPQNIMVGKFAEVQVMDWGMAKRLSPTKDRSDVDISFSLHHDPQPDLKAKAASIDENDTVEKSNESSINDRSLTRFGDVLGTPRYMAPEQARGELNVIDARADVFSLGAILFEILTQKRLYEDTPAANILGKVAGGQLEDAYSQLNESNADAKLVSLCRSCLSATAVDRPEHAGVVAREIGEHFANVQQRVKAAEIELRETEVRANEETKRRKTFSRMLMLVAGVFAIGLAGVLWQWSKAKTAQGLAEKSAVKSMADATAAEKSRKEAVEAKKEAEVAAKRSRDTLQIVRNSFFLTLSPRENKEAHKKLLARDVLFKAKERLSESELDDTGRVELMFMISNCLRYIGEYEDALESWQESLKLCTSLYGEENNNSMHAMHRVGYMLTVLGRQNEAIPIFEKSLKLLERVRGEDHRETMLTVSNLARAYQSAGRNDKALEMHEKTMNIMVEKFGPEHRDSLTCRANVAVGYLKQGKQAVALKQLEELTPHMISVLGEGHPNTLAVRGYLADIYASLGRTDKAIKISKDIVKLHKNRSGDKHPMTLTALNDLANQYTKAGQLDKSIPLYENTLPMFEELGEKHPNTLATMKNLGVAYRYDLQSEKSVELCREAAERGKQAFDESHPDRLRYQAELALSLFESGQHDDAVELLKTTLDTMKLKLSDEHPVTLRYEVEFAKLKFELAENDQAIGLFESVLERLKATAGADDLKTLNCSDALAMAYAEDNQYSKAAKLLEPSLKMRLEKWPDQWNSFETESRYGEALLKLGQIEKSETHLLNGFKELDQKSESIFPYQRKKVLNQALSRLVELAKKSNDSESEEKWKSEIESLSK